MVEILDQQTELCYSPDDGGWYLMQTKRADDGTIINRASKAIFPRKQQAKDAYLYNTVVWEKWY